MKKIMLANGTTYNITNFASQNSFAINLESLTAGDVISQLSVKNLSEIKFLTDNGTIAGIYHNKLLREYEIKGDKLAVHINNASLCYYGLVLDKNNRIISTPLKMHAPDSVEIVDDLPPGNSMDYLRINGQYIYDPLPEPEQPEPTPTLEERVTTLEQKVDSELADQEEALNLLGVYV